MLTQRPWYFTAVICVRCDTAPMGMQDGTGEEEIGGG